MGFALVFQRKQQKKEQQITIFIIKVKVFKVIKIYNIRRIKKDHIKENTLIINEYGYHKKGRGIPVERKGKWR